MHRPVMLAEVLEAFRPLSDGLIVDCTLGAAGHSREILEAGTENLRLLGLDRDKSALLLAQKTLAPFKDRVQLVNTTFDHIDEHVFSVDPKGAAGILMDLGVSSMQFDQAQRGFSFRFDGPLDMRMGSVGQTCAEWLAEVEEAELARVIKTLGEEPLARRIAKAVVKKRQITAFTTTGQLAETVEEAYPAAARRKSKLNPATKTFMALRLLINDELGQLERFLEKAPSCLRPKGRLVVISYHSLEDRRVKKAMQRWANPCTCPTDLPVCVCGKKPLVVLPRKKSMSPGDREVEENPRARSARMRIAIRTEVPAI
ncbi:16S rRNA (cytosine(1402)-N(4))-methyltransferase RsmH [Dethiosulfatarculus sandiegensis]|uniref:Ribosomal RNA small subunit methyltransferase H n=1 Tax=Dethiosulfatarculus sandiegensis TaxID=1429043 RepID=A0A0D2HXQ0_9BACT|nr:16S rRNA (cytosine(1402)-N(4))-methyltransferase RsmH [Dethiosulfatarculus sandiegensis]KIX15078.1 16S rRNA methyltransferase [Dethiosulfatarculus sandiegensis]